MTYLARLYFASLVFCLVWGTLGCVSLSDAADVGEYPWAADLLRLGESLLDIEFRVSGCDSVYTKLEANRAYRFILMVQSREDSLVGRTLWGVFSNDVAHVDHEFRWMVSPLAGDRRRIEISDPVSVDQGRQALHLVAPSLEPGEYITNIRPAESVEISNGEDVSVLLPNTINVFVRRGDMKFGRVLSVESVGDSFRVYQNGLLMPR